MHVSLEIVSMLVWEYLKLNLPRACVSGHAQMLIFKSQPECFSFYGSRHAVNFELWQVNPPDK